jgi:mono/diheme cytochrome c family protein
LRRYLLGFMIGILVLPVAICIGGWMGLLPTKAKAVPPAWETRFAHMALDAAAARNAPHLTNPIAPTYENLLAGMKLFRDDCAGCHGTPTSPNDSFSLYPNVPQFWKAPPQEPDWQLFWIVKYGVRYSGMFAWDGEWGKDAAGNDVSDQKIWTAVTFLTHLDSLPPAVNAQWHAKPSQTLRWPRPNTAADPHG